MIRTSSLSGDTWLSYHFPGAQLPPWPHPVRTLCAAGPPAPPKRPGACPAGQLIRAVSLPEQDVLRREPPVTPGNHGRLVSISYWSLKEDRAEEEEEEEEGEEEEEEASDSSGRLDSSCSGEDVSRRVLGPKGGRHPSAPRQRSHNVFLPGAELDDEEEEEDGDGDNLHRYREDSSFVLHGNFNWALSRRVRYSGSTAQKNPPAPDTESLPSEPGRPDSPQTQRLGVAETSTLFLDRRAQDLNNKAGFNLGRLTGADAFPVNPGESASDSSCNSSDGILVNFCTIYSKSHKPATPQDPATGSGPTQPAPLQVGSVFLNLQPVGPHSPRHHPQHETPSPQEEPEVVEVVEVAEAAVPSAPRWSPQVLDSNCNLYSLEPWSSLELSDLTACLPGQLTLAMGTNQKYYKLVSCDPPSASPSPSWPCLGRGLPEGPHTVSPGPSSGSPRGGEGGLQMDRKEAEQHDDRRYSPAPCHAGCTSSEGCSYQVLSAPLRETTARSVSPGSRPVRSPLPPPPLGPVAARPSGKSHPGESAGAAEDGACSWAPPLVRYTKAQRPTSLPIEPFVLLPQPKPQSQPLGSLLDQYVSRRSGGSSGGSQGPGPGSQGASSQLLARLQASPLDGYGRMLLEAPSSSDTCSTCSPSPESFGPRCPWGQVRGSAGPFRSHHVGTTQPDFTFKLNSINPSPRSFITPQTQPSLLVETPTSHFLIDLTHETPPGGRPRAAPRPQTPGVTHPGSSHSTPPTLACTSLTQQSGLLGSLSGPPQREPPLRPSGSRLLCSPFSEPSFSSSRALGSCSSYQGGSVLSVAGPGGSEERQNQTQNQSEHRESLMLLSDRPPTEFCLSPSEVSYESLSISHLQRRGLLRSVSSAMDLIMAHFGSSRDPEEKMRLGSSRSCPTVAGLVLEHLCPAIQNILEDGLRHHKLDVVIGQQRNHAWRVVDASTQKGRASRILDNLVSKIHQCSLLISSCVKLRAFIMGLLNLRALEFWLSHLQSQNDVVTAYYHSWAFMTTTQTQCPPLFQELLLLLQPLSVLPFDLNLLLESRHREQCSTTSPVPACSTLLMTTWPKLQAEVPRGTGRRSQRPGNSCPTDLHLPGLSQEPQSFIQRGGGGRHAKAGLGSPRCGPHPGWWIRQPVIVDGVIEEEDRRSAEKHSAWSQRYHATGLRGVLDGEEATSGSPSRGLANPHVQAEGPARVGLRWAKLFGAAVDSPGRAPGDARGLRGPQCKRSTRPSQWLQLDSRSALGQLALSVWTGKVGGAQTD